jgi:hypothetical protein
METFDRSGSRSLNSHNRKLVFKILESDSPVQPAFVNGNLCNPQEVLTPEERAARDLALASLAETRARDAQNMPHVIVN